MFNFGDSPSTSRLDQANSWSQSGFGMGLQSLQASSLLETDTFSRTQGRSTDYSSVDTRAISSSITTESTGVATDQTLQAIAPINEIPPSPGIKHFGHISGNVTYNGAITTTEKIFLFTMAMGSLRATLSGLSANANMQLFRDSNLNSILEPGEKIVGSTNASTNNEYITLDGLGEGLYFLQVTSPTYTELRLNLNVSEGTRDFESEPNNSLDTPDKIDGDYKINLNGSRFFRGALNSTTDTVDYWRFKVDSTSQFKATLSGLSSDANLELLDAGGRPLFSSNQPGVFVDTVQSYRLDAGTYFFKVTKAGAGTTPYNLDALAVPLDDAKFTVTAKQVRAIDSFDLVGQADFNVGAYLTDSYGRTLSRWSGVFDNDNDITPNLRLGRHTLSNERYIPFTLKVYDSDGASSNDYADLSPIAGVRDLELTYDAMLNRIYDSTGRYYGKANQDITVQGNGDADRAAITFKLEYLPAGAYF